MVCERGSGWKSVSLCRSLSCMRARQLLHTHSFKQTYCLPFAPSHTHSHTHTLTHSHHLSHSSALLARRWYVRPYVSENISITCLNST